MRLSLCLALVSVLAVLHGAAAAKHHKGHHKALAVGRSKLKVSLKPMHQQVRSLNSFL
jgi:hypothetical protein